MGNVKNGLLTYDGCINYLYSQLPMYQRIGNAAFKKDLKNIKALTQWLNNPQDNFRSIHIAGTNGKGSVAHLLAAYLHEQGYKVGLYTSPHYRDFRERIKINGELVSKHFVKRFVNDFKNKARKDKNFNPSFFELTVGMAFQAFKENQVDFAIIETGLGGRLDSTNIIEPILSIITNISFDHQTMLGNTLKKIAKEKAGIIKKNIPVIIGESQNEVFGVFDKKAKAKKSKIFKSESLVKVSTNKKTISVVSDEKEVKFVFPFLAEYQLLNLRTFLASIKVLSNEFPRLSMSKSKLDKLPGLLKKWQYLGRMQMVSKNPIIIFDSAHNQAGIEQWLKMVDQQKFKKLHLVIGTVNDKDLEVIFSKLPIYAKYYFVQAKIPRAMDKEELKTKAEDYGLKGRTYSSVKQGLKAAKLSASASDLICVLGSIFVVAEVV